MLPNRLLMAMLLVVLGASGPGTCEAVVVPVAEPTATFSQSATFSISKAIDGSQTTGWAIHRGGSSGALAETAAFETVSDAGFSSGTVLTFTLDHQLNATYVDWYSTGKLRLSVTTANRSLFADGQASGGDVGSNSIWVPLQPLSAVSSLANPLHVNYGNNTILAGGATSGNETYTIRATTPLHGITGVRLEVLEDTSLPGNGPGRAANGNLVLSEFTVDAQRLLQNATATFSQGGFPVGDAIDEDLTATGWAIAAGAPSAQTAVFETAVDMGFAEGSTMLVFTLDHQFGNKHTLGKFRLSATTDDRSLFADGLATGGDVTANWVELVPASAVSDMAGVTMTINPDNTILVGGDNPDKNTYTVIAYTNLTGITGFRLEALEDPLLGTHEGPGRQPLNGNFVLTTFAVAAIQVPEPDSLVLLVWAGLVMIAVGRRRTCRRRL